MAQVTLAQVTDPLSSREELAEQLDCPFPLRVNPCAAVAQDYGVQWIDSFYQDPELRRRVEKAKMAWFVAGFYPEASEERLKFVASYLFWVFGMDDLGDETPMGQRPDKLASLFEKLDEVFDQGPYVSDEAPTIAAFRDVVRWFRTFASEEQVARFREGNRAYFGGILWEAHNRAYGWVPSESSYVGLRPAAGAVPPFFALIEPMHNFALSPAVRKNPGFQEVERLAGGIVCWINDILSYEKERAQNDVHNLAIVYEVQRGLSPNEALRESVRFNNSEVAGFVARSLALFPDDELRRLEAARYVASLESMIRITRDWTLGSARYAGVDGLDALGVTTSRQHTQAV